MISEITNSETAISKKTQKVDEHQGPSSSSTSRLVPGQGLSIPHPAQLTKWTPSDVPSNKEALAPLPPVLDPVLEKASRTHSGVANGLGELNYEKLEWIGDAYLYLVSSAFIFQTFPNLPTGRCSQLRERLIKNEALSEFTVRYGIDKRARLPSEFQPDGRRSGGAGGTSASKTQRKKILGDLFEAYVAAAILSDEEGLGHVTAWLKTAWGAILHKEIKDEYKSFHASVVGGVSASNPEGPAPTSQQPLPSLNAKVVLSQTIGTKGVSITYRDEGEKKDKNSGLPWYTVGAYYDGLGEKDLCLGYGGGLSKKDAGANAAVKALENKKLMKRLRKIKEDVGAALAVKAENV